MPFTEPDRTSFEETVRRVPKQQADLLTAATSGQTTNDQALVTRPDYALGPEQLIIAVLGLTLALLLPRLRAASAIVGLVAVGSPLIGGWLAFKCTGLLFDPLIRHCSLGSSPSITLFIYQMLKRSGAKLATLLRAISRQRWSRKSWPIPTA